MIRHIVLVRLDPSVAAAEEAAIFEALRDLQGVVPGMRSFASGPNVSPEGLAKGFTHAFVASFDDEAARNAYLVHPAHRAAGARLVAATEGGLDGLVVLDFEAPT